MKEKNFNNQNSKKDVQQTIEYLSTSELNKLQDQIANDISIIKSIHETFKTAKIIITTIMSIMGLILAQGIYAKATSSDWILRWLIQNIYSPEHIYNLNKDNVEIKDLKKVKKGAPDFVFNATKEWSQKQYEDFIKKEEFVNVVTERFNQHILAKIELIKVKGKVTKEFVSDVGKLPIPAALTMLPDTSLQTNCGHSIDHSKDLAVVVVPHDIDESYFLAYGCNSKYPNQVYLRIVREGEESPLINSVRIVGREKNSPNKHSGILEIRVTQSVAKKMRLSGADSFTAYLPKVQVSISKAE